MMMMMNEDNLLCSCQRDDVPFRYVHPDMLLAKGEINNFRDENLLGLVARKKLHLVLDLDQTLIHTSQMLYLTAKEKDTVTTLDDVYTFSCNNSTFVMKLRPGIREFFEQVTSMFDVSVYTLGSRNYAKEVHTLLVSKAGFPKGSWVITREDSVKPGTKRLDIVLSHERAVLIVDDTEDVWGGQCRRNLVTIGRYFFFPMKEDAKEDNELERVLKVLKGVHNEFYYGNMEGGVDNNVDYLKRDVRLMIHKTLFKLGVRVPRNDVKNGKKRKGARGCGNCRKWSRDDDDDDDENMNGSIEDNLSDLPIKKCSKLEESISDTSSSNLVSCNEKLEESSSEDNTITLLSCNEKLDELSSDDNTITSVSCNEKLVESSSDDNTTTRVSCNEKLEESSSDDNATALVSCNEKEEAKL